MSTKSASAAKKGTKSVPAKLVKANLTKAVADVKGERLTKYRYPTDVVSKDQKKKFRRNARAANKAFEKALVELGNDKKAVQAKKDEFAKWTKETYHPVAQVTA